MQAEIITIGDELLLGQTVDTNSAWMGEELRKKGVSVNRIVSISDRPSEISAALDEALSRVDLVLVTGGLGPTRDDVTKHTLADYFNTDLVLDQDVLDRITAWFEGRKLKMLPPNCDQALLPESCVILPNPRGTAMGMWFDTLREGKDKVVVSMPGVPYEMKGLMEEEVMPRVESKWSLPVRYQKTVLTQGIGESFLSAIVHDWEEGLESRGIGIAYLPAPGQVRIRLSSIGEDADSRVDDAMKELLDQAGEHVVAEDGMSLEEALIAALGRAEASLSTAESCTGGSIAARLTAIPGASAVFEGSIVAYANGIKTHVLGVDAQLIEAHGAVSEEVVRAMAEGVRKAMKTTYALATSGIAGPGGATPTKAVGTIWIALASPKGTHTRCLQLGNHRGRNIARTALECMGWLLRELRSA